MNRKTLCALALLLSATAARASGKDGYILKLEGNVHISRLDLESFRSIDRTLRGDVLWVRRAGRSYEIRDAAILARAAQAMQPAMAISREYDAFEARTRGVHREEEELDRRVDEAEDAEGSEQIDEARLIGLREARVAMKRRMAQVEREEALLDRRQEEVEAVAENVLDRLIEKAFRHGLTHPVD